MNELSDVPSCCSPCQDDSEAKTETKFSEKDSTDKNADLEGPVHADESADPDEDIHLVEGGKKDPYLRRQELLVNSGLAEVCVVQRLFFSPYLGFLIFQELILFLFCVLLQVKIMLM